MSSKIDLIGVPFDLGASVRGTSMGAQALRIAGIGERLASLGHHVHDTGDVTQQKRALHLAGKAKNAAEVAGFRQSAA